MLKTDWIKIDLPVEVKSFLTRALIIFICWKLLYHLVLFPIRVPDRQLTNLTAVSTAFIYKHLLHDQTVSVREDFGEIHFPKAVLLIGSKKAIGIADPCNGLELFVLYIGFIFCLPTSLSRQIIFIIGGSVVIYVANCFRCLGLAWLIYHHYSIADFAHHYLFKMIIYAMIFYGWLLYSKKSFLYAH